MKLPRRRDTINGKEIRLGLKKLMYKHLNTDMEPKNSLVKEHIRKRIKFSKGLAQLFTIMQDMGYTKVQATCDLLEVMGEEADNDIFTKKWGKRESIYKY